MNKFTLIFLFLILSSDVLASTATSHATSTNLISTHGMPIFVSAYNTNEVKNDSDKILEVKACYNIQVEGCGQNFNCWNIKVNPHGTWHDHWSPHVNCRFLNAGNYKIHAFSTVSGTVNSQYDAFSKLTVY